MTEVIPVPCRTCGASMEEANRDAMYGRTEMVCSYCGAREQLPSEPSERVRALRQRLAQISWNMQAVEGPAIAAKRTLETWRSMLIPASLIVVGVPVFTTVARLTSATHWSVSLIADVALTPLISISLFVGIHLSTFLSMRAYKRDLEPKLLAFAPAAPGAAVRCRRCGGELPSLTTRRAFLTCSYCQAENLVTAELSQRLAVDLDRELTLHRERAAGMNQQMTQGHERMVRRMNAAVFAGVGAAGALAAVAAVIVKLLVAV